MNTDRVRLSKICEVTRHNVTRILIFLMLTLAKQGKTNDGGEQFGNKDIKRDGVRLFIVSVTCPLVI